MSDAERGLAIHGTSWSSNFDVAGFRRRTGVTYLGAAELTKSDCARLVVAVLPAVEAVRNVVCALTQRIECARVVASNGLFGLVSTGHHGTPDGQHLDKHFLTLMVWLRQERLGIS